MRLCHLVTLAASGALGSIVTAQTFAQTGAGTTGNGIVVGIVVAMGSNAPLPYADVVIETLRRGTFADSLGRFRLTGLPVGVAQLRARRLGFAPITLSMNITATPADTLRIELTPVSLRLNAVRTKASRVCGSAMRDADTVVVAILDLVRGNAERSRLLAREYPFEVAVERTIGDRTGRRESIRQVDTIVRSGGDERDWQYKPGSLVRPVADTGWRGRERLMIPELVDFGDETFIGAHCFQYAGLERIDDQQLVRLAFEPGTSVTGPDVSGSLYLSPDTYQLRRSTLHLERVSPSAAGYLQVVDVESTFREVVPFVPVLDALYSTMTTRSFTGMRGPRVPFERQQLVELRFLRDIPSTMTAIVNRPTRP